MIRLLTTIYKPTAVRENGKLSRKLRSANLRTQMLQGHENQRLSDSASHLQDGENERPSQPGLRHQPLWFRNPRIRAIWRFLLFLILVRILLIPVLFSAVRPFRFRTEATLDYLAEGLLLVAVLLGTAIMARIDRRQFFDYGLRDPRPLLNCLKGALTGFSSLTLMLLGLQAAHHSHFGPQFIHGTALLYAALLNVFEFLLTALYEELMFRGYSLCTLAEGVGFWPGALAVSMYFAWEHTVNPGESRVGIAAVFVFGIVLAFSVWRSGSLLWAIGFHFMWDYSESFIYGVPDSGLVSPSHFLSTAFSGPAWITGGTVGPEGSYFIFLVLAVVALTIHLTYPSRKFKKA
jgi:membrane protease YdiL (CAAX protease family)